MTVQFNQGRRGPGEFVQITVKAAPGSTVALSAVDKSLQKEIQDINLNMVMYHRLMLNFLTRGYIGAKYLNQSKNACVLIGR